MRRSRLHKRYGRSAGEHVWRDSPRRVQILRVDGSPGGYWKPGQYGYVLARSTSGGSMCVDRYEPGGSKPGEPVYLVSKARHGRGGALWFSEAALRFPRGKGDRT
jgi:hypothetical protein